MFRTVILALLVTAFLIPAPAALAGPNPFQDDPQKQEPAKKGPLAEIRDRIIELERNHRRTLDALDDALFEARQKGDEKEIQKIEKQMEKAREEFREDASQLQQALRKKVAKAGFDEYLAEHRKVRREVEEKIRKLRHELNEARLQGDTKAIAKAREQIDKVQNAFLEKLRRALQKMRAEDDSTER
jgi:hypothetical protein